MISHLKDSDIKLLLEGCKRNELESQQKLYKHFYGFAMAKCMRYSNNRYEAAEILNDGFLKIFNSMHKYNDTFPFQSWLGRIMTNTAIDHYRAELKHSRTEDLSLISDIAQQETVYQSINYNDILKLVQQLPVSYRTVFNLYAIDGYTHEEIAKMLGISDGTSKSHLHKARQKLKKWLLEANEIDKEIEDAGKVIPFRHFPPSALSINGGLEL